MKILLKASKGDETYYWGPWGWTHDLATGINGFGSVEEAQGRMDDLVAEYAYDSIIVTKVPDAATPTQLELDFKEEAVSAREDFFNDVEKEEAEIRELIKFAMGPKEDLRANLETSLDEFMGFRTEMFNRSAALAESKGADYNRQQQEEGDTLFNIRVGEIMGIGTTEQGLLFRLSDKFMRLVSLAGGATPEVKDESVLDTIRDMHNYLDMLGLIYTKRRK